MKKNEIEQLTEMAQRWEKDCASMWEASAEIQDFLSTVKPDEDEWQDIQDEMPKPGKRVQVICQWKSEDGNNRSYQTVACHRPKKWEDASFCDLADEWAEEDEDGNFWWPEGWYDGAMEAEEEFKIERPVTYWRPLPPAPETSKEVLP